MQLDSHQQSASARLTLVFAAACGLIVANLYYAQPLVAPISHALGIAPGLAGLVVTLTQVGYGLGLILIVPLADILENRKLVLCLVAACTAALVAAAFAPSAPVFLAAAMAIGLSAVSVQVLVPFAAHLAPDAMRGRAVGNVMSGLLLGIMLARPASSFIASLWGWHAVFGVSSAIMVLVGLALARMLPERVPAHSMDYGAVLASMWHLLRTVPALRRRGAYHACLFGAFSLFWTTVPLLLAGPAFQLGQRGIALFALAGVAGAVAAPIAGLDPVGANITSTIA
ncbi:MFS transporter, partial [Oxalobacteraceae bacterium OM1]